MAKGDCLIKSAIVSEVHRNSLLWLSVSLSCSELVWAGAQRIAAELKSKGIANISHQTVHRAFKKYHLPTKTYHPKGKSNGIRYKRLRKQAPNQMWHLDFAGPIQIADGKVYVLVLSLNS